MKERAPGRGRRAAAPAASSKLRREEKLAKTFSAGTRTCSANVPSSGRRMPRGGPSTRGVVAPVERRQDDDLVARVGRSLRRRPGRATPRRRRPGTVGRHAGPPARDDAQVAPVEAGGARSTTTSPAPDGARADARGRGRRSLELAHGQGLRHSAPSVRQLARALGVQAAQGRADRPGADAERRMDDLDAIGVRSGARRAARRTRRRDGMRPAARRPAAEHDALGREHRDEFARPIARWSIRPPRRRGRAALPRSSAAKASTAVAVPAA